MPLLHQLRQRPRLLIGAVLGAVLATVLPWAEDLPWSTQVLIGWSSGVWVYLVLVLAMMLRAPVDAVQAQAKAIAEGMPTVLGLAMVGALLSLAALALELAQVRQLGVSHGWPHLLVALGTVTSSWLLLPVEFALAYASLFHSGPQAPHGLEFPGDDGQPDYTDFLYFSVTLAATSQTSDVMVSARHIRRLVLVQAVLSFAFNTVVLALTINLLASLLG
ncbi:DUF1345 domain-containing protein [Roseateles sp. SL47]|jgi:uncharacterized membrane protein|uniref:DUF1345 domain-containing protein n=1 Tax=Roseateles sp. SL47 TaxID=2995138 RepID=UPI0022702D81|nr:DUF1345 domain-containing protein [Roseateles sp. SL47]WAC70883.1 DUF1345 domain-containing protein [Roseateles sp. SL47]